MNPVSGFAAIAAMLFFCVPIVASAGSDGPGTYAPTKLEWFVLQAQAYHGYQSPDYSVRIGATAPSTVRIAAAYFSPSARLLAQNELRFVALELRKDAESRGWEWLEFQEQLLDYTNQ
jgi:hypothetical protein